MILYLLIVSFTINLFTYLFIFLFIHHFFISLRIQLRNNHCYQLLRSIYFFISSFIKQLFLFIFKLLGNLLLRHHLKRPVYDIVSRRSSLC